MKKLLNARYYLELISVPIFAYLVIHLAGHGSMMILEDDHSHESHHHEHGEEAFSLLETVEHIFSLETGIGILFLALFVWIWHRPALKKWVPCSHTQCCHASNTSHIFATIAFCLHFFPEASIRKELLHSAIEGDHIQIAALIGFSVHFLVDIMIAFILSQYWKKRTAFFGSLLAILTCWGTAFLFAEYFSGIFSHTANISLHFISAFLLAMFIHKPHKN